MTKTSKKWSSERIIKFLEAYEQYPCLWDHKLPSYKDKSKRDEALRKIVEVMSDPELNVNSAKAKIRSIRNAYTLEHHKVLKSYKNGISGDIYKPTVCWFSVADRFLKGIVETRDTKNASELQELRGLQGHIEEGHENEGNETSFENHYHLEAEETAADNRTVHSLASSTSNQSIKDPQKIIAKRKLMNNKRDHPYKQGKFSNIDAVVQAVNTLQDIARKADALQPAVDEFEAFGKSVAAHLRQLPITIALECQCDILHYLVQKRLGQRASFTTMVPPSQYSHLVSPSYSSPTTSSSTSCSYLMEDTSTNNVIQPSTDGQQSSISDYESKHTVPKLEIM